LGKYKEGLPKSGLPNPPVEGLGPIRLPRWGREPHTDPDSTKFTTKAKSSQR